MNWVKTRERKPTEGKAVHTKIEDSKGVRNEQIMIFKNNLWWTEDMSMYVYYVPSHWSY